MAQYSAQSTAGIQARVNTFVQSVYLWMAGALVITGLVSYLIGTNTFGLLQLVVNVKADAAGNITSISLGALWWISALVGLGLVFYFSARLNKISSGAATGIFVVYSVLMGVVISTIFITYTMTSIASTFFICAATFAATSVFGYVTKRDLTGVGSFMMMGLIGIIIATLVNIFLKSYGLHMIIGYIGVIIFVGLAAYDTQKMKNMALTIPDDADGALIRKAALNNALALYLDFINLFLMLLRIFGSRN